MLANPLEIPGSIVVIPNNIFRGYDLVSQLGGGNTYPESGTGCSTSGLPNRSRTGDLAHLSKKPLRRKGSSRQRQIVVTNASFKIGNALEAVICAEMTVSTVYIW
jgi:hypothetical protein